MTPCPGCGGAKPFRRKKCDACVQKSNAGRTTTMGDEAFVKSCEKTQCPEAKEKRWRSWQRARDTIQAAEGRNSGATK